MLHIYTNTHQNDIHQALTTVEGLADNVRLAPLPSQDAAHLHLLIQNGMMIVPTPWHNEAPPVLFRPRAFEAGDLVALLLAQLGYTAEAQQFASSDDLIDELLCKQQLEDGTEKLPISFVSDTSIGLHNHALVNHYAPQHYNGEDARQLYEAAIAKAESKEQRAFIAKQLANLLQDRGQHQQAKALLEAQLSQALPEPAVFALTFDLIHFSMETLTLPYDQADIEKLKGLISHTLQQAEQKQLHLVEANLLGHASELASLDRSYAESLGYIQKVIAIYDAEELPEFLAAAFMRKGMLLQVWAQDGNPQFYQSAIDSYQYALKTFTRDVAPHIYADIQLELAMIYAEMPVENTKKGMWAAFSATSFKECMDFYTRQAHPYQYAMIANNYANALMKYPPAKTGDNLEKAIYYLTEALEIRTADTHPTERAHTILNYLEACWRTHNVNENMERARCKDMIAKAKEVKTLTQDAALIQRAEEHLEQLNKLSVSLVLR